MRRKVYKSAIIEAAVASFLSGDTSERLEAAKSRRLDRLGCQVDTLDEDLAVLGEALSLFIRFGLTVTPIEDGTNICARERRGALRWIYAVTRPSACGG